MTFSNKMVHTKSHRAWPTACSMPAVSKCIMPWLVSILTSIPLFLFVSPHTFLSFVRRQTHYDRHWTVCFRFGYKFNWNLHTNAPTHTHTHRLNINYSIRILNRNVAWMQWHYSILKLHMICNYFGCIPKILFFHVPFIVRFMCSSDACWCYFSFLHKFYYYMLAAVQQPHI